MAEQSQATLFVSIHANAVSMSRPEINGLETYYASADGQALATTILRSILGNIPMNSRGVKQANFYVIRRTSMPATLVETGFVTGAEDAPRLADPSFRRRMAAAIAQGILTYLQENT
jgi:N-acetylmuramoyl-L-alanine amidase